MSTLTAQRAASEAAEKAKAKKKTSKKKVKIDEADLDTPSL